jgi:3,4-dihydroxy 2-butanone 4-phosphate synthase/GTP cyclohydrolase II
MKKRPTSAEFRAVAEALKVYRRGGLLVVADDARRENEGDLLCAAAKITPEKINFMARHGRGLICVALEAAHLARLGIQRVTPRGGGKFGTAFTESVDAAHGISTGISAYDRAHTIRLLVSAQAQPADFVAPGHVFPLEAVAGGVLRRAGHTEAAVDLARLAGLPPAGVICEVMRADGHMARFPELRAFAQRHHLPLITVADLIAYRRQTERLVECERVVPLPTEFGAFTLHLYRELPNGQHHLALVRGAPEKAAAALVRVHSECLTGDVLGSQRCDCGRQLHAALQAIARAGHGVLLYMRQEGRGIGLAHKIHAYALQDQGLDTVEANQKLGFEADLRDYGIGAQILGDLGLRRIRLMTNNPRKIIGLRGYGLQVVKRIPLVLPHTEHSRRYLETKKKKMGHLL